MTTPAALAAETAADTDAGVPSGEPGWRLGRRPALDGLRGLAVLLVIGQHAEIPGLRQGGGTGVTLFFALSGFLITALLVEEHRASGRVDVRRFVARRAVRLLPALVVLLAVLLGLGMTTLHDAALAAAYVGNWVRAGGDNLGDLGHVWSLAVEEQFYLVWPIAFVLLRRRPRVLLALAVGGAVASAVERQLLWGHGLDRIYFGSDTRADAILAGCALGLVVAHGARLRVGAGIGLVAGAGLLALSASTPRFFLHWGFTPAAVAAVAVVACVAPRPPGTTRVLEHPTLVRTGRLSYGLYLWHFPMVLWAQGAISSLPVRLAVELPASALLALASYHLVEEPLRRRRVGAVAR